MKRPTQREQLIAIITEHVNHLVRLGSLAAFRKLEMIEHATGYDCHITDSRGNQTCEQLGRNILAFLQLTNLKHLIDTSHSATFYRYLDSRLPNGKRMDWDSANALADEALRACGVDIDRWYAKMELRQSPRDQRAVRAA